MTDAARELWLALTAAGTPLSPAGRAAATRYALATETPDRTPAGGWDDSIRRRLISRPDVPLSTAAALAEWPADHPVLTAAYLARPDHPPATHAALLRGRSPATLQTLAWRTSSARLLTRLATHRHPEVTAAVAGNRWAPQAARVTAVCRLIDAGDPTVPRLLRDLDALTATAVALRTTDPGALTTLLGAHQLSADAHEHLGDTVLTAVADLAAASAPGGELRLPTAAAADQLAAAFTVLADRADPDVCLRVAAGLADLGVDLGPRAGSPRLRDPLANRRKPLTERRWPALLRALDDPTLAASTAELLAEHLGDDPGAWDTLTAAGDGWRGTVGDLLTAVTGIAAEAVDAGSHGRLRPRRRQGNAMTSTAGANLATCVGCGRDLPIAYASDDKDDNDVNDHVRLLANPFLAQVAGEDEVDWWCGHCFADRAASI